jgi:hypothetical protein
MKSRQLSERAELEYRVEHKSVKKINPEGDFPELSGRWFSVSVQGAGRLTSNSSPAEPLTAA